jgi:hypothetical protein
MHFQFLLSGPHGDIELYPEALDQPFLLSPGEQHPFLTLADYFGALQEFIMLNEGSLLCATLKKQGWFANLKPVDISEIIIRSEKHGAYYHIASAEIIGPGVKSKFAVTTAVSESASLPALRRIICRNYFTEGLSHGRMTQVLQSFSWYWESGLTAITNGMLAMRRDQTSKKSNSGIMTTAAVFSRKRKAMKCCARLPTS